MLVKSERLSLGEAPPTIALLDHLGIGYQPLKGNVHTLGLDDVGEEVFQGIHDTADWILRREIGVEKAIKVQSETVHYERGAWLTGLLNVSVRFDERRDVIRNAHAT